MLFFFSSRRRHTRCREVSWARRCVQETGINAEYMGKLQLAMTNVPLLSIITIISMLFQIANTLHIHLGKSGSFGLPSEMGKNLLSATIPSVNLAVGIDKYNARHGFALKNVSIETNIGPYLSLIHI
eukprot:TRINITY_DN4019_c0_g1_i1.p1 TRINITY_DN4019_c0_g1~~TRINITY_DN4019_c0_g1_i1.p1  ORF type:complete len:127 (-),score=53.31 TRINITY_DN4019_c0_g1_i1:60-440(-)